MDTTGVLSFMNGMPPATMSKLFSGGLSMDLNQSGLSLNSNLFNSKPVNGSSVLPGIFSTDLHAPGGPLGMACFLSKSALVHTATDC